MADAPLIDWARQACDWAAEAGEIAAARMGSAAVRHKADRSEVTEADLAVQAMLVERIARRHPDHAIIAEEPFEEAAHGAPLDAARFCWVLDPIDGTRNFVRSLPVFATSIALLEAGRPVIGIVHWHHARQTYAAVLGRGATLNERPIHVSAQPMDSATLVGAQLGASHNTQEVVAPWLGRWVVRNLGSTALHLAMVASGNLAAAYAKDCSIWDVAAGALLVTEAGGHCTTVSGDKMFPLNLSTGADSCYPFIAGSPAGHQALLTDLARRNLAE